jgi:hypothetical protein
MKRVKLCTLGNRGFSIQSTKPQNWDDEDCSNWFNPNTPFQSQNDYFNKIRHYFWIIDTKGTFGGVAEFLSD